MPSVLACYSQAGYNRLALPLTTHFTGSKRDVWICVKGKSAQPQLARVAQGNHSNESTEPSPRLMGQLRYKDMIDRIDQTWKMAIVFPQKQSKTKQKLQTQSYSPGGTKIESHHRPSSLTAHFERFKFCQLSMTVPGVSLPLYCPLELGLGELAGMLILCE